MLFSYCALREDIHLSPKQLHLWKNKAAGSTSVAEKGSQNHQKMKREYDAPSVLI